MPQPAPPDPKTAPSAPDVSTSETWDPTAFDPPDFYDLEALLSEEARHVRDDVRTVVTEEVMPIIEKYAQRGEFPRHLISTFAEHGLLGSTLPPEYGGEGHSNIAYGLIMQELERGDSGLRSFCSVTGALVMYPIWQYGSDAQRERWLPALANGEAIGCFGLTEPDVGSNPAEMQTRARRDGDGWVIDGHKRWSTNATIADVAVIWAKDEDDTVRGFLVETDRDGVETPPIDDSWSLRAAVTSEVVLDDVRVPDAARLPEVSGLKGPLSCLTQARYGICWGTIGAAMACFDTARQHAQNREQFGGPIGRFQLMQERLVDMVQEITKAQLLNWRLGTLKEAGTMRPQQVSLAKRNNCQTALDVARSARQVLGGNGVTSMYPVMRHMNNLESVVTYEGTHEVHTLIVGEDVTGLNAFT
ncbi:acyl-CoA dehydrogenase family protein [Salinibacter ruber]|uniref:acyl-CoA dehydrogenase family protein n=1 Tax=Salinibacter ruber TaxID=146919 RepID=UPI0020740B0E|nr:acyl-CoA dehydrogenase family protein [Salinibacter ruber]MCS3651117.1 glutaryl-CoA dehydrogenase [Salinibacter ruber]MCS3654955.1 glutaryl-CoA dehydrogenase [Salinibacter ruber]MCS3697402.1 glutaryl-CoA dehydrogenase [Salinibacter ruber]MCS4197533.1 glutaryl-CoA dehydrogenase [Salinibacter ruber]